MDHEATGSEISSESRHDSVARAARTGVGAAAGDAVGVRPSGVPRPRFQLQPRALRELRCRLCQYCEAQAMAERAAAELQNGAGESADWALKLWEKANKVMSGLALRLRLGPQSRREKAKVARPLTWSE